MVLQHTDVTHDFLAYLAQEMIDLNKSKQIEMNRFLSWLEQRLVINEKNGQSGIDSLNGKTLLKNYLGDYQKGTRHCTWGELYAVLEKNKNRFGVDLESAAEEIYNEACDSLAYLLPIKDELRRADWTIDAIVYRLYGLNNDEIKLIEYPQYEQAVLEAKLKARKGLSDNVILSAGDMFDITFNAVDRFFNQVRIDAVEQALDGTIFEWSGLPNPIPTLLRAGEHTLSIEQDDYSICILFWLTAAVTLITESIFERFKEQEWVNIDLCYTDALAYFIRDDQPLTLVDQVVILTNPNEVYLFDFMQRYGGRCKTFLHNGIQELINDASILDIRFKSLSSQAVSYEEAMYVRDWAIKVFAL
jgi:hypothetical protein